MSWISEIMRAFFVAFGTMQTISNSIYLLNRNGLELARKQHKELPDNITDKQIKMKTICMLLLGITFLIIGLYSFFSHSYYKYSFIIAMGVYMLYALTESLYYRFWKTFGAFILSIILLLLAILSK